MLTRRQFSTAFSVAVLFAIGLHFLDLCYSVYVAFRFGMSTHPFLLPHLTTDAPISILLALFAFYLIRSFGPHGEGDSHPTGEPGDE